MVSPSLNRTAIKFTATCEPLGIGPGVAVFCLAYSAYPAELAISPAPHSACRQLHAIDGQLAEPSQYAPQYLLPGAAGQLQPGCAHFSIFLSAIKPPWLLFQLPKSIRPPKHKINPA